MLLPTMSVFYPGREDAVLINVCDFDPSIHRRCEDLSTVDPAAEADALVGAPEFDASQHRLAPGGRALTPEPPTPRPEASEVPSSPRVSSGPSRRRRGI